MVHLAYSSVEPVIDQLKRGELSREEARSKISDLVREMTYEDEFGPNYIFMSAYDGTMLVQPYEPEMEGTDQWLLQDARNRYIIQELVHAAKTRPDGSFVTYDYYLPDHSAVEEKLSFVMGIPEIEAYIGTGMYVESTYRRLEAILQKQSAGYLAMTIFILSSLLLYAWVLLKNNQRLQREIQERTYAENNLWTIFDTIHDAIMIHDENGRILHANKQSGIMYGLPREDILDYGIAELSVDPALAKQWLEKVDERIEGQGFIVFEWPAKRPLDGTLLDVEVALRKTQWSGMSAYVAAVRDITERKQSMEKIHHLAYFDSLTGLPNRAYIMNELRERLDRCASGSDSGAAFFIDVDNFKVINDTHGHFFGDRMLVEIAGRLDALSSQRLTLSRLGGDEFLLLSAGTAWEAEVPELGDQILAVFREAISIDNASFQITCSIGIAVYPRDGRTVEDVLKHADLAMYKAKTRGRNQYVLYDSSMVTEFSQRTDLEKRLKEAYKSKEFLLHYQPQVDTESGRIVGIEALIRWNSAPHGLVFPGSFITVAEEMGLINEIGKWVIERSFAFARSLMHKGICVSCNVSPVQLKQSSFVEDVIEAFDRYGLRKGCVALEITESCLVESFDETYAKLAGLKAHGIMIYLDDFGTGYSSLNYMKNLPIDALKIDKSFIDNITADGIEGQIVKAIVSLTREIGLKVVAEGVETQEQQAYLAACGCTVIQGYLFSKPVSEEEILALL
jgi:diguanylate cyclase (GGDEF)-like protein/PAS domain S-box-containing protein